MNRRDLLQTLATSPALGLLEADSEDSSERRLTYEKTGEIDSRQSTLERYLIEFRGDKRAHWKIKVEGEEVFQEEFPLSRLGEHHYRDTVVLRFYKTQMLEETLGATMFSCNNRYAYHKHPVQDDLHTYAQDLIEGGYELL